MTQLVFTLITIQGASSVRGFNLGTYSINFGASVNAWPNIWLPMISAPNPRIAILGENGATTYVGQPTGYVPPGGRPSPDPLVNVTNGLNVWGHRLRPTYYVLAYTGADITNGYDILTETIPNIQNMVDAIVARGSIPVVCTPQPQTGYSAPNLAKVELWRDEVLARPAWNPVNTYAALASGNNLNPAYDQGDGNHLNVAGQTVVANTVAAAVGI